MPPAVKKRKGRDTRITGIVVIGIKRYAIKLTAFPKTGAIVDIMNKIYTVKQVKFKEVEHGMIPVIYLIKTIKDPRKGKKNKK